MPAALADFQVAAIGAGLGSKPHFRALDDLRAEFPCAWVCARDAVRLQAAPVPQGAQRTSRIEDVLDDPRVRAVLVLTPPAAHLEVVRRVAAAGKHVLVEKPLELDLPRAREVVRVCEDAGVSLAVMFQFRMRAGALRLAALLRESALGALTGASAQVRWWRPQSYYDEPGRGTYARDGGGVLVTQAIHTLDLLLTLIGAPERVTGAMSTSAVHRMEGEDCASALLHYAGGAVAVVQATTAAYPGWPERIEINGTLATATLESGCLKVQWMDGRSEEVGSDGGSGGGADPMAFDHGPHRAVIADFLQAARDGRAPQVTGRSALAVHATIAAITDSARSGHTVPLATYL